MRVPQDPKVKFLFSEIRGDREIKRKKERKRQSQPTERLKERLISEGCAFTNIDNPPLWILFSDSVLLDRFDHERCSRLLRRTANLICVERINVVFVSGNKAAEAATRQATNAAKREKNKILDGGGAVVVFMSYLSTRLGLCTPSILSSL